MFIKKSILIVSNQIPGKYKPNLSPFVIDQAKSIKNLGHKVILIDCNPQNRPFMRALFLFIRNLKTTLRQKKPDIVHIQSGGVWGLFTALIAYKFPKIITFHGTDLLFGYKIFWNLKKAQFSIIFLIKNLLIKFFSVISILFMDYIILVNTKQVKNMFFKRKYRIIPCGVDVSLFRPIKRSDARKKLNLDIDKYYLLFINPKRRIKNVNLAHEVVEIVRKTRPNTELLCAENVPNTEMFIYYNAVDLLLITSFSEGSPVTVKEALACNTPVISVDVGDISKTLQEVNNCFVVPFNKDWLAEKVIRIIDNKAIVNTKRCAENYSLENVAQEILVVYGSVTSITQI